MKNFLNIFFNFWIKLFLVAITMFFSNALVYSTELSSSCSLRIPLNSQEHIKRFHESLPAQSKQKIYYVYDKNGKLIKTYYGSISKDEFSQLDGVKIKAEHYDIKGYLIIGNRLWFTDRECHYRDRVLEIDVKKGLITEVNIYDNNGIKIEKRIMLSQIFDGANLEEVFYKQFPADRHLSTQVGKTIITYLSDASRLYLERPWFTLGGYKNRKVEFKIVEGNENGIKKGLITEARIYDKDGIIIEKTVTLSEIHNADGSLMDVYLVNPKGFSLSTLIGKTIITYLTNIGSLYMERKRPWFTLGGYKNRKVEFKIVEGNENGIKKGLITEARIYDKEGKKIEKPVTLSEIHNEDGSLMDVYYKQLPNNRSLTSLIGKTIKDYLNDEGRLYLERKKPWFHLMYYPNRKIEVKIVNGMENGIKKGLITEARIYDKDGIIIEKTVTLSQICEKDGTITDVYYGHWAGGSLSTLNNKVIKQVKLDGNGRLFFYDRNWRRYPDYPNAEIELYIENDEVALIKIIKDKHGNLINSRIGLEYGRINQGLLLTEKDFCNSLKDNLIFQEIYDKYAGIIAETLVRLRRGSLEMFQKDGLLTENQVNAIDELDIDKINMPELVQQLNAQIAAYQQNGFSEEVIIELLSTHLLPIATIERLQRTYNLEKDIALIREALKHPDVEAWIKRKKDIAEQRGTLDTKKHLKIYDPDTMPVLTPQERQDLIKWLTRIEKVLIHKQLLDAKNRLAFSYTVQRVLGFGRYEIKVSDRKLLDKLKKGEELRVEDDNLSDFKIEDINPNRMLIKIVEVSGSKKKFPNTGVLETRRSDIPTQIQLELISDIISSLELSRGKTTGNKFYDRLFGLDALAVSDPNVATVTEFFNPTIPYEKFPASDWTTKGYSKGDQSEETAVKLGMNNTEILFIDGPAATGKTTTLVEIIQQAVRKGKKILLVSQMHKAIDNALADIINDPLIPVLRLGNDPDKFVKTKDVDPEKVWPGNSITKVNDAVSNEFTQRMANLKREINKETKGNIQEPGCVFVATDMGLPLDWFFNKYLREEIKKQGDVDLIIMDESSRENLSGALGVLQFLKKDGKFICVGDIKQLHPHGLSKDEVAELINAGVTQEDIDAYQTSILEFLSVRSYGDRVMLSTNYRNPPLIVRLGSELFYEGDVHCGRWEDFDEETLSLRVIDVAEEEDVYYEDWRDIYDEDGHSYSCYNSRSAEKVLKLVDLYKKRGLLLSEITILTPYKAQKNLIEDLLLKKFPNETELPIVTTIDSYQGDENKAIIYDFVRSNPDREIGFLKDLRRLNVGLSRAKQNLALIWDSRVFEGTSPLDKGQDEDARKIFQQILDYYEKEVLTFFPDSGPLFYSEVWKTRKDIIDQNISRVTQGSI